MSMKNNMKLMKMNGMNFLNNEGEIFPSSKIEDILELCLENGLINTVHKKGKNCYDVYNIPVSFDIETTSFVHNDRKYGTMYLWAMCICGLCVYGRTWEEFLDCIFKIKCKLDLSLDKRLIIYIQNLEFEFGFIRKYFVWDKVFAMSSRRPLYARTVDGIEFRCSYLLSGYSLEKIGENLTKYKVKKLVGDLDYDLIRHYNTPITQQELRYMENDVRVVVAYIKECIEQTKNKSILQVPLTNTGRVRQHCSEVCLGDYKDNNVKKFKKLIRGLKLNDVKEYEELKRAFQGGFTHASCEKSGKVLDNVASYDFTSAYIGVATMEKFPMSTGRRVKPKNKEEFEKYLKKYCCMFDIEFSNIEETFHYEHSISVSKCFVSEDVVEDNGRVVSASKIATTITEQDFYIISKTYKWESFRIANMIIYVKDYLPKEIIQCFLDLYQGKTTLKGIKEKVVEYMNKKGMLNAIYGMMVTDIMKDIITYEDGEWNVEKPNGEELIEKYNKNSKRFLFYPWGVWVTAYNRKNLFSAIFECKKDYCYSDTDSCKIENYKDHEKYFNRYNDMILKKIDKVCERYGLDKSLYMPKNQKGEVCVLGVWDFEGVYDKFKTLGAKRYLVEKDGEIELTCSGIGKKNGVDYLLDTGKNVFEEFNDGLTIPPEYSGKLAHCYNDDEFSVNLTDYMGNTCIVHELSSINLFKIPFEISISKQYLDYILQLVLKYKK